MDTLRTIVPIAVFAWCGLILVLTIRMIWRHNDPIDEAGFAEAAERVAAGNDRVLERACWALAILVLLSAAGTLLQGAYILGVFLLSVLERALRS
jgi:uncharacterized linocin/CFP29 family protein